MPQIVESTCIKIVVADDHVIFRQSLINLLAQQENISVIGQSTNGKELLGLVAKQKPDVVIINVCMPQMSGLSTAREIIQGFPNTGVIALSNFSEKKIVTAVIQAGIRGYLSNTANTLELISAIENVHNNGTYYCRDAMDILANSMRQTNTGAPRFSSDIDFSEKELTIIKLICKEHSNKEIASKMGLSTRSVESTRERLQAKTGRKNMVGIAIFAIKHGLLALSEI